MSGPPASRSRAISGIKAGTALAATPNTAARSSTTSKCGDIATYLMPARMALPIGSAGRAVAARSGRHRARTRISPT